MFLFWDWMRKNYFSYTVYIYIYNENYKMLIGYMFQFLATFYNEREINLPQMKDTLGPNTDTQYVFNVFQYLENLINEYIKIYK